MVAHHRAGSEPERERPREEPADAAGCPDHRGHGATRLGRDGAGLKFRGYDGGEIGTAEMRPDQTRADILD
jgi:hypothetical protein